MTEVVATTPLNNVVASKKVTCPDDLIKAAQHGDVAYIRSELERGNVLADSGDIDGCTMLHWASINARTEVISLLIDFGANINVHGGTMQETPVMWAVRSGKINVVHLLLERGGDMSAKNVDGIDALQLSCRLGHGGTCFMLLHRGANPDAFDNNSDNSLIWLVKNKPESTSVMKLLLRYGASVQHKDANNENVLHLATRRARNRGSDIDFRILHSLCSGHGAETALLQENDERKTPYKIAEVDMRDPGLVRFFWDAWMFQHFPYYMPVMLEACSIVAGLFVVRDFKWTGLIIWFVFIYIPTNQLSQPTIVRGDSRTSCGSFLGLLVALFLSYKMFVEHAISYWTNLYMMTLFASTVVLLVRMMLSQPQTLSGSDHNKLLESLLVDPETEFCTTCLVVSSTNTAHCSRCDVCVVDIDNHCPLVLNCAGKNNRRLFVLLILSGLITSLVYVGAVFYVEKTEYCHESSEGIFWGFFPVIYCMLWKNLALLIAFMCSLATCVLSFNNLVMEIYFISVGATIYAAVNRNHDGRCHDGHGLQNVVNFFRTGQYKVAYHPIPDRQESSAHDHHHGHRNCCHKDPVIPECAEIGQSFSIDANARC